MNEVRLLENLKRRNELAHSVHAMLRGAPCVVEVASYGSLHFELCHCGARGGLLLGKQRPRLGDDALKALTLPVLDRRAERPKIDRRGSASIPFVLR